VSFAGIGSIVKPRLAIERASMMPKKPGVSKWLF
jgi:hypothetical protein